MWIVERFITVKCLDYFLYLKIIVIIPIEAYVSIIFLFIYHYYFYFELLYCSIKCICICCLDGRKLFPIMSRKHGYDTEHEFGDIDVCTKLIHK